jgi:hypothetical protein
MPSLPIVPAVFGVRHHIPDKDSLFVVMYRNDQAEVIPPYIENRHLAAAANFNKIGMRIGLPDVVNGLPLGLVRHDVPSFERRFRLWMISPKLDQPRLADNPHGPAIPLHT